MKKLISILFFVIGICITAISEKQKQTVIAELSWGAVTNWTPVQPPSYVPAIFYENGQIRQIPQKDSVTEEIGSVHSNLTATIKWNGQLKSVILESIPVAYLKRRVTLKSEKVYEIYEKIHIDNGGADGAVYGGACR